MTERPVADVVAIVPARRGSKGIPGKNLVRVGGRSLVARSVDAAEGSELIRSTIVTTDDPAVRDELRGRDITLVERPPELADDRSELVDVVLHACEFLRIENAETVVVLLQPTSPFRTAEHIDACVRLVTGEEDRPAALTVTPVQHHPAKMLRVREGTATPFMDRESLHVSRQSLEPLFRQNGAVYAIRLGVLAAERTFCPERCGAYTMSEIESLDVDEPADIEFCDWVASRGDFTRGT